MFLSENYSDIHIVTRWVHMMGGISWLGPLFLFNLVNIPFPAAIDKNTGEFAGPQMLMRSLWLFRWGAVVNLVTGIILFTMNYMFIPGIGFGPSELFRDSFGLTGRAIWTLIGVTLAMIMFASAWFIIWPIHKRLHAGGIPPDQMPAARRKSALVSRINLFLSGPMLFGMMAPSHYGVATVPAVIAAIVFSEVAILAAVMHASKIKTR